jgi:hypothetical protein
MRTCTPPSTTSSSAVTAAATTNEAQLERPVTNRRVDERVAERAAEQERRRREAVSFIGKRSLMHLINFNLFTVITTDRFE